MLLHHALPNALAPTLQVLAFNVAWLTGGVVVVESVFHFLARPWPGECGGKPRSAHCRGYCNAYHRAVCRRQSGGRYRRHSSQSATAPPDVIQRTDIADRARASLVVRGVVDSSVGRAGLTITSAIALLAFVGPWLAPYDPTATLMLPLEPPSVAHLMGADALGRDALSRYLNGGQVLVAVAFAATIFAYVIGIPLGMAIGYRRGLFDLATIALADLILAFPAIIFVLVLAAAAGTSLLVVIIGIATINLPRVVRIARTVTIDSSPANSSKPRSPAAKACSRFCAAISCPTSGRPSWPTSESG